MEIQISGSPIHQAQFNISRTWEEFQSAILDVAKSFPNDFKFGDIDENEKIVSVKYTKPPFDQGLNVFIKYKQNDNRILIDFFIEENSLPAIKKQEAINLSEEFGNNIYYSFSNTLHLTAEAGPQKDKREKQLNNGGGIVSLISIVVVIFVIIVSFRGCS